MTINELDIKFIIADDDIEIVRRHRDCIRELFPENKIYEFTNGFEACAFIDAKSLANFKAHEWVVISDFYMPIKKGVDVMKKCNEKGIIKACIVSSADEASLREKMQTENDFEFTGEIISKSGGKEVVLNWIKVITNRQT
jgi:response regulator of citrate/malate metabolism